MPQARLEKHAFGKLPDGREVDRIVLRGEGGFEARIITHGAAIQSLIVPDVSGHCDDVVLGHDALAGYLDERKFFGATVGRYANRIAGGHFTLDGERVQLPVNNGPNALHGGLDGFDRKLWTIAEFDPKAEPAVALTYSSPDGEENYPGRLDVRIIYRITGPTELSLTMEARTDRPTIVNLTNHSFFNLEGATSGMPILDHELMVSAEHFLAIDPTAIPLPGPPIAVAGTPFDFRQSCPVGARIRQSDQQLRYGKGYDHTYCLRRDGELALAARLRAPRSGRVMELFTDQPGLQVYSGNYLDGTISGKGSRLYRQSDAICLEPHIWPDAPNRPDFPSPRLDPGAIYRHHTIYRFSTEAP